MGFLDLFRKNREEETGEYSWVSHTNHQENDTSEKEGSKAQHSDNWETVNYSRDGLNVDDAVQRKEYVQSCLQQMEEGNHQLDELQFEYRTVTSYLHDMEAIDELPEEERAKLNEVAARIHDNEEQRQAYLSRTGKLTDKEYERIEALQGIEEETTRKIVDAENYQKKIRKDLMRLDNERQAYEIRVQDLEKNLATSKYLMIFTTGALLVILIILLVLQMVLNLNVVPGYLLAILAAALAGTGIYLRHSNFIRERKQVRSSKARLIQLQNTVKIRYVNNRNLLDYMYLKYGVASSNELVRLIERYHEESQQRREFEEAERALGIDQKELMNMLRKYEIETPEIWLHQTIALINHNEEVEVRHALIVQRQSLRKRMDYNREIVVDGARNEIEDLARTYPPYANEILEQVAKYRGVTL